MTINATQLSIIKESFSEFLLTKRRPFRRLEFFLLFAIEKFDFVTRAWTHTYVSKYLPGRRRFHFPVAETEQRFQQRPLLAVGENR